MLEVSSTLSPGSGAVHSLRPWRAQPMMPGCSAVPSSSAYPGRLMSSDKLAARYAATVTIAASANG